MSSVTQKPVWTLIPLIDQTTFEKRVLRAFPFAAKAIDGTDRGVMQGKTRHWQAEVLHFSAQFPLQKREEDDPRDRFNRLRKMEQVNSHPKLIQIRETIKVRLRDLSIDYINLLDEVDDYESLLTEDKVYSDTVPHLTLLDLRKLTDKHTIFSALDYVDLSKIFLDEPLRLVLASELNTFCRRFNITKELYETEIAQKITTWITRAVELLNDPVLDEIELRGLLAAIHAYDTQVQFINRVDQLYKQVKSKLDQAHPKIKASLAKLKNLATIQDKAIYLLRIVQNLAPAEAIDQTKIRVVSFKPDALLLTLSRYKAAYEGLKKLPLVKLDDLDEWFTEVQESIENEEFDRAERDFELMKEVFFQNESVQRAVKTIASQFRVQIESMNNFRSKAFFDEIRTLFSTQPLEEALQKVRTESIAGYKLSELEVDILIKLLHSNPQLSQAIDRFSEVLEKKHHHNKTNFRLSASTRLSDPLTSISRFLNLVGKV